MPKRKKPWPAPGYLRGPGANTDIRAGRMTVEAVERYLEDVAGLMLNPAVAEQVVHTVLDPYISQDELRVLVAEAQRLLGPDFQGLGKPPGAHPE